MSASPPMVIKHCDLCVTCFNGQFIWIFLLTLRPDYSQMFCCLLWRGMNAAAARHVTTGHFALSTFALLSTRREVGSSWTVSVTHLSLTLWNTRCSNLTATTLTWLTASQPEPPDRHICWSGVSQYAEMSSPLLHYIIIQKFPAQKTLGEKKFYPYKGYPKKSVCYCNCIIMGHVLFFFIIIISKGAFQHSVPAKLGKNVSTHCSTSGHGSRLIWMGLILIANDLGNS